jgi:hypothetical protein
MAKDVKNDLDNYVKIDETKSLENNDFYIIIQIIFNIFSHNFPFYNILISILK